MLAVGTELNEEIGFRRARELGVEHLVTVASWRAHIVNAAQKIGAALKRFIEKRGLIDVSVAAVHRGARLGLSFNEAVEGVVKPRGKLADVGAELFERLQIALLVLLAFALHQARTIARGGRGRIPIATSCASFVKCGHSRKLLRSDAE